MKLWLIRHAVAVEADAFSGSDMERPLTGGGRKSAQAAFKRLAHYRQAPDIIISSQAVRARQTAGLLGLAFGMKKIHRDERLNPGCRFKDMKNVVAAIPGTVAVAALVGHEPDISRAVSRWTSDGQLALAVKKGAWIELEVDQNGDATLLALLPPDLLGG